MSLIAKYEYAAIGLYRVWHRGRMSPCRFTPSCSQYALDALDLYGFFKGNRLIFQRLLRCRPWGGSGFDPVPVKVSTGV
jgi:uncharacterized protein